MVTNPVSTFFGGSRPGLRPFRNDLGDTIEHKEAMNVFVIRVRLLDPIFGALTSAEMALTHIKRDDGPPILDVFGW